MYAHSVREHDAENMMRSFCVTKILQTSAESLQKFSYARSGYHFLLPLSLMSLESSTPTGSRICDSSQLNDLVSWLAALTKSLAHTTNVTSHLLIDTHTQVPLWNLSLVLANHPDCMIRTHSQSAILSLLSSVCTHDIHTPCVYIHTHIF